MGERLFYVSVGGEPGRGPFTLDAVRTRIAGGSLKADALVCEVGSTAWRTAASLDSPDAPAPSGPLPPLPPPPPPPGLRSPPRRSGKTAAVVVAIVAILVLGGGIGAFLWLRPSVPELCPATPKLLASLHTPVVVDAYVTRGLPTLDKFVVRLQLLLAQYQAAGAGNFRFTIIEPKDEDSKRKAKEAGLIEQPFGEVGKTDETATLTKGYMGLVFHYGDQQEVIQSLAPDRIEGLEFWIDNKLRELRAKADGRQYRIGVLTGHREMMPDEKNLVPTSMGQFSIQGIITQNFPFYRFSEVDLHGGSAEVDPALQGLLVTQPESDLTDAELARIDAFVLEGKPVAFFVGAVNVRRGDASMHATLSAHGIERLLAGYGVELGRDLVVDGPKASASIATQTSTGLVQLQLPFAPVVGEEDHRLDASSPVFLRMSTVALPMASSLVLHRDKQPEATLRELARSTPRAVRVTSEALDLRPFEKWTPTGAEGPVVLAVSEDGTIHGAFDPARKSKGRARVLVIASSQFLANPLARAGNGESTQLGSIGGDQELLLVAGPYAQQQVTATILAFKNTLDWLSFEDDLVDCSILPDAGH